MSGPKSNNHKAENLPKIFPAEKERLEKRRVATKLIFSVFITNILVYSAFTMLRSNNSECTTELQTKNHQGFSKIVLPVTILTYIVAGKDEYKVSIYNGQNKQIIETAYFHPYETQNNSRNDSGKYLATIEIPTKLLSSIKTMTESFFLYPFHKNRPLTKREKQRYELIL